MRVEGINQSVAVELVRLDPGKTEGKAREDLARAVIAQNEAKDEQVHIKEVEKAVELLNKTMENYNTELKFTLHEKSGEYMVKVINTKDNTVIREVPPEWVLDMVAYFKELIGIVVDKFI
ncbi:MAG: flagellar protein FlaG [Peptococcaceae bacterium]|nr:flagellar protein FlaG [Peptococcaceae bacterium]